MKYFGFIFSLILLTLLGCGKEAPKSIVSFSITSDNMAFTKEETIEKNGSPAGSHHELAAVYQKLYPKLTSTCALYGFINNSITSTSTSNGGVETAKTEIFTTGIFTQNSLGLMQESISKNPPQRIAVDEIEGSRDIASLYADAITFYKEIHQLSPKTGKVLLHINKTELDKKSQETKIVEVSVADNKLKCKTTKIFSIK